MEQQEWAQPAVPLPGSCQTQALGQKGSCLNFSGAGKVSFSLVSRGQELAHTQAPQHSAHVGQVPLWNWRNVSNPLETSTGKIPLGWKFPFACRPFLRELFGPRAWSLCKSHICFVAKPFISVTLSLSGLISASWCLPGAGSFCRGWLGKVWIHPAISETLIKCLCSFPSLVP